MSGVGSYSRSACKTGRLSQYIEAQLSWVQILSRHTVLSPLVAPPLVAGSAENTTHPETFTYSSNNPTEFKHQAIKIKDLLNINKLFLFFLFLSRLPLSYFFFPVYLYFSAQCCAKTTYLVSNILSFVPCVEFSGDSCVFTTMYVHLCVCVCYKTHHW